MEIILLAIVTVIVLIVLTMMFSEMVVLVVSRIPFVPTAATDILDVAKRVPVTEQDVFYDLGSGNGKVVFLIEKHTGARTKGFQLAGWTHWYAQIKKFAIGSKAELVGENFFKHNLQDATVVYTYLYPFLMKDVGEKILAECKPGTKVVSRDFAIPNLPLYEEWQSPSRHLMRLYIV